MVPGIASTLSPMWGGNSKTVVAELQSHWLLALRSIPDDASEAHFAASLRLPRKPAVNPIQTTKVDARASREVSSSNA